MPYQFIHFLFSCISPLYINHHRHIDIILNLFIPHFLSLVCKHNMLMKMPKIKDFYISFLRIDTIVSICVVRQNLKKFSIVRYLCDFPSLKKSMFFNSSVSKTLYGFLYTISAGGKWVATPPFQILS